MRKDVGSRKLGQLALGGLVCIRRESRDIDKPGHAWVGAGVRDQRAAIGVPDEKDRAADPGKTRLNGSDVTRKRVEAMLGGHHFMAIGL